MGHVLYILAEIFYAIMKEDFIQGGTWLDFIIVTGMSGSGKSIAMDALEDLGYYCVDNVPPQLLRSFVELNQGGEGHHGKMALGIDTRSHDAFGDFSDALENLKKQNISMKILFLDASDQVLLNRYKENRRKHPLVQRDIKSIQQAISKEREILFDVKQSANFIVDTSKTSAKQLKHQIVEIFSKEGFGSMMVHCISFGFKYGIPLEPDLVFDVRCLPNPYYLPELRHKTGLDKEVKDYVMSFPESVALEEKLFDLIDFMYPLYEKEGRLRLVIAIGCTGGKHRSVTFVEALSKHLEKKNISTVVLHRDIEK